ncbi:hypothetical protein L9F63_022991, partial [Diploptera punctata]
LTHDKSDHYCEEKQVYDFNDGIDDHVIVHLKELREKVTNSFVNIDRKMLRR